MRGGSDYMKAKGVSGSERGRDQRLRTQGG
jgi:hypothetical protein